MTQMKYQIQHRKRKSNYKFYKQEEKCPEEKQLKISHLTNIIEVVDKQRNETQENLNEETQWCVPFMSVFHLIFNIIYKD